MVTKEKQKKTVTINTHGIIETVKHIKLDDLIQNPYQPETRIEVDPDTAKKFAYSIQEHGLIQMPALRPASDSGVRQTGDCRYRLLPGALRDVSSAKGICAQRILRT